MAAGVLLQDCDGQIAATHSISAGLDYPGVGPEHAYLLSCGRARYQPVTDREALAAFQDLCRLEGIIPALETSHALALAARLSHQLKRRASLLINLSGRGDTDVQEAARLLEEREGRR